MGQRKRVVVKAALWGSLSVGILALAVALLVLANAFNPMQLAFLESFDVVNQNCQDIDIMPIGMMAFTGKYGPLPRYKNWYPPAVALDSTKPISVAAGSRIRITYDCDDVNFRHILVGSGDGAIYIVDTDSKGTKHACYGPQKKVYLLPPLEHLQHAPIELVPCFHGHEVAYSGAIEYAK